MINRLVLFGLVLLIIQSCTLEVEVPDEPLMVFAAASTTDAVREVMQSFQQETHIDYMANYAATSVLARQIETGAQADIFISADDIWSEYLAERNFIIDQIDLLTNTLVIVVPKESDIEIEHPRDLESDAVERIAIGDPEGVPAGIYAKQALVTLNLWDSLYPKLTMAFDVRQALMNVEQGETDAGFVYATDAMITDQVRVVHRVDSKLHHAIRYPVMLLQHAEGDDSARQLFVYLQSETAKDIFEKYGFTLILKNKVE